MIERQAYREIRPADFTPRAGDKGRERILGASICGEPRRAAPRRVASPPMRADFAPRTSTGVEVASLD